MQSGTPLRWWRSNVRRPHARMWKEYFRDTESELARADSIGQRLDVAKSLLRIAVHRLSGTAVLTAKVTS